MDAKNATAFEPGTRIPPLWRGPSSRRLMGILPRERRRLALLEVRRVLKSQGRFLFSAHDREGNADWYRQWHTGSDLPPGDVLLREDGRTLLVHCPRREDVLEELEEAGFVVLYDAWRGDLPPEPEKVLAQSLDCRLWVAAPSDGYVTPSATSASSAIGAKPAS